MAPTALFPTGERANSPVAKVAQVPPLKASKNPEILDYQTNEIYPPIIEQPVDYDLPESKVYGPHRPCPALIQNETDANLKPMVKAWLTRFNSILSDINTGTDFKKIGQDFKEIFTHHAAWRDHLALGWDFHTFVGLRELKKRVIPLLSNARFRNVKIDDQADHRYKQGYGKIVIHEETPDKVPIEWIQVYFTFDNKVGTGKGVLRLCSIKDSSTGLGVLRCFTFYTTLEDFKDFPEQVLTNRPDGVNHGQNVGRESWLEKRARESKFSKYYQPTVLIVGGGQGGLAIAARLKSFGINSLIIEKNLRVGDNWRLRYKFLVLHDPVWYDQMPYLSFPPNWPVYTPKDKLADWFEGYAKTMDLNIRCNATVQSGSFNEYTGKWRIEVKDNETGELSYYRPIHVILATGHSGEPRIPEFRGQDKYKGRIIHSSQYGTGADYQGGRALVVGGCSSAHDICQDFYEQGVDVTMLQRSSTCVITSEHGTVHNNRGLYDEDGPATETADRIYHSMPLSLLNGIMQQQYRVSCRDDAELLESLNKVGFKTNAGFNGTGLFGLYFRVGSGYYIDVGCSGLIAKGKVKLKQGESIKRFTRSGVEFTDGSRLENLDVVVFATGFTNMKESARKIFGDEVAEKLHPVWGLDEEGEIKTMWRESGHPNFWFMGGNLAMCRYYSKRLALRIVAQEKNIRY